MYPQNVKFYFVTLMEFKLFIYMLVNKNCLASKKTEYTHCLEKASGPFHDS